MPILGRKLRYRLKIKVAVYFTASNNRKDLIHIRDLKIAEIIQKKPDRNRKHMFRVVLIRAVEQSMEGLRDKKVDQRSETVLKIAYGNKYCAFPPSKLCKVNLILLQIHLIYVMKADTAQLFRYDPKDRSVHLLCLKAHLERSVLGYRKAVGIFLLQSVNQLVKIAFMSLRIYLHQTLKSCHRF